jgi:hypothetical protein
MSLKTTVTKILDKAELDLGKGFAFLDAHVTVVIAMEKDLIAGLENPVAEGLLATVLPPSVIAQVPNIEAILEKAITDELIGSKILTDINAQPTLQGKLQVFLTDLQNTPGMNKGIIRDICLAVLAALNNNALTADAYAFYIAAKKMLGE